MSNKVTFPKDPKASTACKTLINKILAPLKTRARISTIKSDPWYNYSGEKPGSSREQSSVSHSYLKCLHVYLSFQRLISKSQRNIPTRYTPYHNVVICLTVSDCGRIQNFQVNESRYIYVGIINHTQRVSDKRQVEQIPEVVI